MSFIVTWNGTPITDKVISYQRSHSLCSGTGTLTLTVEGQDSYTTWDTFVITEDGTKKATYNASTITKNGNLTTTINAENGTKRMGDYFIHSYYNPQYLTTARYWIELFLDEAGVDYTFNVATNGTIVDENSAFGRDTVYSLIFPLLQQSGWYIIFDEDNDAEIGKLDKDLSNPVATFDRTEIMSASIRKDDKMSRNKAIVWGGMDYLRERQIMASVTVKQNWQIDSNDIRPILVTNSSIQNYPTAYGICWQLINEFSPLTKIKELEVIGFSNVREGDVIFMKTDAYTGTGMITSLDVNVSSSGIITRLVLDERCPRIFAFFAWNGYVYAGTWGDGVYRKPLEVNSWSSFSTGLDNLYIKDLYIQNGVFVCIADDGYAYYNLITDLIWRKINHGIFLTEDETEVEEEDTMAIACSIDDENGIIVGYNHREEELSWVLHFDVLLGITRKEQIIADDTNSDIVIYDLDNTGEQTIISVSGEPGDPDTIKGTGSSSINRVSQSSYRNSYLTYNTHEFLDTGAYNSNTGPNTIGGQLHHGAYIYCIRLSGYPSKLYLFQYCLDPSGSKYVLTDAGTSNSQFALALAEANILVGKIYDTADRIVKFDFTPATPTKTVLATLSGYTAAYGNHAIFSYEGAVTIVWGDILDGRTPHGVIPVGMEDIYVTHITAAGSVSTTGPIQTATYTRKDGSSNWIAMEYCAVCDEVSSSTAVMVIRHNSFENALDFSNGNSNATTLESFSIGLATGEVTKTNSIEWTDGGADPDLNLTMFNAPLWIDQVGANKTSYLNACLYASGNINNSLGYNEDWTFKVTSAGLGGTEGDSTEYIGQAIMWAGGTGGYDIATKTIAVWDGSFPVTTGIKTPFSTTCSDVDGAVVYYDNTLVSGIIIKGADYTKYIDPAGIPTKIKLAGNLIYTEDEIIWSADAIAETVSSSGVVPSGIPGFILRDNYTLGTIIPSGYAGFTTVLSGIPGSPHIELSKSTPTAVWTESSGIVPSYMYSSFTNEIGDFFSLDGTKRVIVDDVRVYTHWNADIPDSGGFKIAVCGPSVGLQSIDTELVGDFFSVYSGIAISGIKRIETSNYDLPPFFFASTGSGGGQQFYQRNPASESFFENSTGLPASDITIIRLDDGM